MIRITEMPNLFKNDGFIDNVTRFNNTQNVLAACDLAIVASGTATLEAAILSKPMVVIYKSNFFSNFILSNFFLKSKFIALPNILSQGKSLCLLPSLSLYLC